MSRQDTSDIIFRRILAVYPISILIIVAGIFFQLVWASLPTLHKFGIGFLFSSVWALRVLGANVGLAEVSWSGAELGF